MRLLAITPTLGTASTLPETVASVLRFGDVVDHVLVAPLPAHGALRQRYPGSRIVADPRNGLYEALNAGLAAQADRDWNWFTYLNDDDIWLDGMAEALAAAESAAPQPAAIYGRVKLIGARSQPLGELPIARRAADLMALLAQGVVPFAQPGTLMHRSLVERLGGFDVSYRAAGDLDLFVRALLSGAEFSFLNRPVAAFRLHAGQISKDESVVDREKERAIVPVVQRGRGRRLGALFRFRLGNLVVYADRIRRFGLVPMRVVYRKQ